MKSILIISPYNPFTPILSGSSRSLRNRIVNLSKVYNITLLTFSCLIRDEKRMADDLNIDAYFVDYPLKRENGDNKITRLLKIFTGQLTLFKNIAGFVSQLSPHIIRLIKKNNFDLIQIEDVVISPVVKYLPEKTKRFIFFHNLLTLYYASIYTTKKSPLNKFLAYTEYLWIKRFEKRILRNFDVAVVLTHIEKKQALSLSPNTSISEIPLEVNLGKFNENPPKIEFPTLTFSGTMSYRPNHEASLYFIKNIFPQVLKKYPATKVYIVGINPKKELISLANENIIVTGKVESVQEYLLRSNIIIVPLLTGGGMRVKILEAFALSKAVVSTSLGAEGIEYTDNKDIIIADGPENFANKVCWLLDNNNKVKELGKNARCLIEQKYSTDVVWNRWKALYDRLIGLGN